MKRFWYVSILFGILALNSCKTVPKPQEQEQKPNQTNTIKSLSLRQKVGMLFVVRPESFIQDYNTKISNGENVEGVKELSNQMLELYEQYPAGGIVLFAKNIENPEQLKAFTNQIHSLNTDSIFVCIDEEGGRVARIANNKNFDVKKYGSMGQIGSSEKTEKAFEAGKTIGTYLKDYDIDINFAPVADVNSNPKNEVIGDRAFSSNAMTAAEMSISFLQGLSSAGVQGCIKHFPGHGDTEKDTHYGYAETEKNWAELLNCEIIPFKYGIENGANMIMTAHISVPAVTGNKEPSTFSYAMLTQKLRQELGYNGVIITDALEMGAVRKEYDSATACIKAINAGADLLLMPFDYVKAFEGVVKAVESGVISEKRIDQSIERIQSLKVNLKSNLK